VVVSELISHLIAAFVPIVIPLLPVFDAASAVIRKPFAISLTFSGSILAIALTVSSSILAISLTVASTRAFTSGRSILQKIGGSATCYAGTGGHTGPRRRSFGTRPRDIQKLLQLPL
jgi:hypothetical protein